MTNKTQELDEITSDLWVKYGRPGTMDEFVPEAKRAILRWVADEVIGNNGKLKRVKNAYRHDISGYTESMTKVSLEEGRSRNRLRNEQRKILAKHGYKGDSDER